MRALQVWAGDALLAYELVAADPQRSPGGPGSHHAQEGRVMDFGVIGGTGFYCLDENAEPVEVNTRFGVATATITESGGRQIVFIARHGTDHTLPPHRVNYRANIAALKDLGVKNVLATASVGSLSRALPPGALAAITQFLDFTRGRPSTFFDGDQGEVVHVDVTDPYCSHLGRELSEAARALGETLAPGATYVCVEGPRFETAAEIEMFRRLGGELVGMTNVPEVVLAREAGICYAAVAAVTNWAAGISPQPLKHEEVSAFMEAQTPRLRALFEQVIGDHREIECECRQRG